MESHKNVTVHPTLSVDKARRPTIILSGMCVCVRVCDMLMQRRLRNVRCHRVMSRRAKCWRPRHVTRHVTGQCAMT